MNYRVFGHKHVSVLTGGLTKWRKEGRPIETSIAKVMPVNYSVPILDNTL